MNVIISRLNEKEKKQFEELLKEGKTIEEIAQIMNKGEDSVSSEPNVKQNITNILNNSSLTIEEKFELLKDNMNPTELSEIQKLIDKGMSVEEALRAVANINDCSENLEESEFAKLIRKHMKDKVLNNDEILEILRYVIFFSFRNSSGIVE